ncbi:MAG: DUF6265 family protein [Gammaproteobacteria bacterium]|nr:DUF6265 family protein [Gammaproteobacteria bacterium]
MWKSRNLLIWPIAVLAISASAQEIEDLDWMTGNWVGDLGPMELEETWNEPKAGSIQAMGRLRNGEEMMFVELVVIEEHNDSFRLRFQQWQPGMEPAEFGRQSMRLVKVEDQMIAFEAEDEGPLKELSYRRKSEFELEISVVNAEGEEHTIVLNNKETANEESQPEEADD